MKKSILFIMVLFTVQLLQAQQSHSGIVKDSIYTLATVDKKPDYPGGMQAFVQFVSGNIDLSATKEFNGGKVIVSFVVNYDGSLDDIKVLRDPGFGVGDEITRLLIMGKKWLPGELNGQKVKVNYVLPVTLPKIEQESAAEIERPEGTYLFKDTEIKPDFPGGIDQFYRYIGKNYRVPQVEGLHGKVFVTFTIDVDGSVTDIRVLRDIGFGTGAEAIRVLKSSPKWNPGIKDGIPVRVIYSLPINMESNR